MKRTTMIGITVGVVIIVFAAFFIFSWRGRPGRGFLNLAEMNLDEDKIIEVSDIFENAESLENVSGYCTENRFECRYYCLRINPDNEFCGELEGITFRR